MATLQCGLVVRYWQRLQQFSCAEMKTECKPCKNNIAAGQKNSPQTAMALPGAAPKLKLGQLNRSFTNPEHLRSGSDPENQVEKASSMASSSIRFFLALGLGIASTPFVAAAADEGMLRVYMDHARVLKLDRPVSKVIIGNSKVADATVADAQTIVLTGRSFGTTNIVLLDAEGNAIIDERILVSIDEGNTVRVFRSINRSVLSCTPNCEAHTAQDSATASQ